MCKFCEKPDKFIISYSPLNIVVNKLVYHEKEMVRSCFEHLESRISEIKNVWRGDIKIEELSASNKLVPCIYDNDVATHILQKGRSKKPLCDLHAQKIRSENTDKLPGVQLKEFNQAPKKNEFISF